MSQELLFTEPSIAGSVVCCQLRDGIEPADGAFLCRCIGSLSPNKIYQILSLCKAQLAPVNIENEQHPIAPVSIGPSGINGPYQNQWNGEPL